MARNPTALQPPSHCLHLCKNIFAYIHGESHKASAIGQTSIRHGRIADIPATHAPWERLTMMGHKKKHTTVEIAAKVAQAQQMAAQGEAQADIAKALGVSVMTLHRWRKLSLAGHPAPATTSQQPQLTQHQTQSDQIAELQLENSRLRRLVTDLLLEKMTLEEAPLIGKPSTRRSAQ
jgi:putative transposase